MQLPEVVEKIKGLPGSTVELKIQKAHSWLKIEQASFTVSTQHTNA